MTSSRHRRELLELGAGGRLLSAGDVKEVLPLDDADLLDAARPISPDGQVKVKAALAYGPIVPDCVSVRSKRNPDVRQQVPLNSPPGGTRLRDLRPYCTVRRLSSGLWQ